MSQYRVLRIAVFMIVGLLAEAQICHADYAANVPTFKFRAQITSIAGQTPTSQNKFTYDFSLRETSLLKPVRFSGTGWGDWLTFGPNEVAASTTAHPTSDVYTIPMPVLLDVTGITDTTIIHIQITLDETNQTIDLYGHLFGPFQGIALWRDPQNGSAMGTPHAGTFADYNHLKFWVPLSKNPFPDAQRPRRFPISDRFISTDDDRLSWQEGLATLPAITGENTQIVSWLIPHDLVQHAGLTHVEWDVYAPPGSAFAYHFGYDSTSPLSVEQASAINFAQTYAQNGYAPGDVSLFKIADEPAWYYPCTFGLSSTCGSASPYGLWNSKDPNAKGRFAAYLAAQCPLCSSTDQPLGRGAVTDPNASLHDRQLYYWTMRFFPYDSARYYAQFTQQLQNAFSSQMHIYANWSPAFSGRFYVPGPLGNNPKPSSPDAAMGSHDWEEFAHASGATMLWSEDWFPDGEAYKWSFLAARLRSAGKKLNLPFGGYIVGRENGITTPSNGILLKVMSLIGGGGKAVFYYLFGPEYELPGNSYAQDPATTQAVISHIAQANQWVGSAEDLLLAGQPPQASVAIVMPTSAQVWDRRNVTTWSVQAAGTSYIVDYMLEVSNLYLALQHANIPTDILDEDDLTDPTALRPYKVIYLTEPNVPIEALTALGKWVKQGGVLATVCGAGMSDRYDTPYNTTGLASFSNIQETPRQRIYGSFDAMRKYPIYDTNGSQLFTVVDTNTVTQPTLGDAPQASAKIFFDKQHTVPALFDEPIGSGHRIHFAFMPGLSYFRSSNEVATQLPTGFSTQLRNCIIYPTQVAHIASPVAIGTAMVETPILQSNQGIALIMLNWTGSAITQPLTVTLAQVPFTVKSVQGVKSCSFTGTCSSNNCFQQNNNTVTLTLNSGLDMNGDLITLRP